MSTVTGTSLSGGSVCAGSHIKIKMFSIPTFLIGFLLLAPIYPSSLRKTAVLSSESFASDSEGSAPLSSSGSDVVVHVPEEINLASSFDPDPSYANAPTGTNDDPVAVANTRSQRALPTGLEGQEWFWKKLEKVTAEVKTPLIPEFQVVIEDTPKK
jgi:hypothetical protein